MREIVNRRVTERVLLWGPLWVMPFMLNLRWEAMIARNEEPKWAVFMLLLLALAVAGAYEIFVRCRLARQASADDSTPALSLPGLLFLLFFAGLAYGVSYSINPDEGFNRLAFWCAGGITFWATAWAARLEPSYPSRLQLALVLTSLLLCLHFWYSFFVDFHDPDYNKFVQFSRIGHFNFTADVLMILIPLLVWTLLSDWSLPFRIATGFSLASTSFMLLISGSLGGMGGLVAGGLMAGGLGLMRRFGSRRQGAWRVTRRKLIAGAVGVSLLLVAGKTVFDHMPKEYREGIFVRAEWWEAPRLKDIDQTRSLPPITPFWVAIMPYLGARTPMWASTAGMVAEHPWRGFGTGSFLFEYPGFDKRYDLFRDPETEGNRIRTNPHNILLQIASENGIPLTLLFVGLYLWLLLMVVRQAWRQPDAFWLCGVWALCAAGLDAQVNHVFFNPASLFIAGVGFGLWLGCMAPAPTSGFLRPCPLWRTPLAPLLATCAAVGLTQYPLRWLVSEYYVGAASRLESATIPASPRHILSTWQTALDWSPRNARAIYGLASTYYEQGQYGAAENWLRAFLALAPHHTPGLLMLADLESRANQLDAAEATLREALRLEPNSAEIKRHAEQLLEIKEQRRNNRSEPVEPP